MSEQDVYSEEWHKGFQMGLYSGIATERERIIKLLEEERNAANEQTVMWNVLNGAIAFIKGEIK